MDSQITIKKITEINNAVYQYKIHEIILTMFKPSSDSISIVKQWINILESYEAFIEKTISCYEKHVNQEDINPLILWVRSFIKESINLMTTRLEVNNIYYKQKFKSYPNTIDTHSLLETNNNFFSNRNNNNNANTQTESNDNSDSNQVTYHPTRKRKH